MPKFFGELKEATLENRTSDPSANTQGRIWLDQTVGKAKLDDGTTKRALLRNDDKLVVGNSVTADDNVRFNRAAASVLQLLQGGNATVEGALSASALAQLSSRLENYLDAGKPAPGNPGRLIYVTDLLEVQYDNGATWLSIAGASGGYGALGVTVVTSNTVLTSGDAKRVYMCNSSAGSFTIELPSPSANLLFSFKDFLGHFEEFPVTILRPSGSPTTRIEGLEADYILRANYGSWNLICDGTHYYFTE